MGAQKSSTQTKDRKGFCSRVNSINRLKGMEGKANSGNEK